MAVGVDRSVLGRLDDLRRGAVLGVGRGADLGGPVDGGLGGAVAGDGPTYVSFDVDSLDPGFAPGTGTPEVGGLSPREASASRVPAILAR